MNKCLLAAMLALAGVAIGSEPASGNNENADAALAAKEEKTVMHNEEPTESEDELMIVPVPSLVSVLIRLEAEKGESLTEAEVLAARDNAASIAMPRHAQQEVEKSRGYVDIDPENVWVEWLAYKAARE